MEAEVAPLKVYLLEPFCGGSHKAFAEGWRKFSRHHIHVVGLSSRFWKWRMRSAAFKMASEVARMGFPDVIVAGSMMDIGHFKALMGNKCPPIAAFFHESQAAYPWPADEGPSERDYHFIITDLASAGVSDRVFFNSQSLKESFFYSTRDFLQRMPDHPPLWVLDEIESKTQILHLGVDFGDFPPIVARNPSDEATILWCHRWEYDKNPKSFFRVLFSLAERGLPFKVVVAGTRDKKWPEIFDVARERLGARLVHWGQPETRAEYLRLLSISDIVVSTANHETFGIGMVEAAYAGAHPLAPDRLSYPEVIPSSIHDKCIYADEADLEERLAGLITNKSGIIDKPALREAFSIYDWKIRVKEFDNSLTNILQTSKLC